MFKPLLRRKFRKLKGRIVILLRISVRLRDGIVLSPNVLPIRTEKITKSCFSKRRRKR